MKYIVIAACVLLFILHSAALNALGWAYSDEAGNAITKFHPVTYILVLTSVISLMAGQKKYWTFFRSSYYLPYFICSFVLVLWSFYVVSASSVSSGAVGTAVTSFFTPTLLVISLAALTQGDARRLGLCLRVFMVLNSLVAVYEYKTHTNIFLLDEKGVSIFRSEGLLGHPLSSALMTGMMIVHLLTATSDRPVGRAVALAEIGLHSLAMFLFGSRTGLVLVPLVVTVGALLPSTGSAKTGWTRRIVALTLVTLALASTQLDIPFIQEALRRFSEDNSSTAARTALLGMVALLSPHEIMFGVDYGYELALLQRFGSQTLGSLLAIENVWLALTFLFGLVIVAPLGIALVRMIYGIGRTLDRSANLAALYFFIFTAGNIAFASKSLLICQLIVFNVVLCQVRRDVRTEVPVRRAPRPRLVPMGVR